MSDYRELINEAIEMGRNRFNEEEDIVDEPIENLDAGTKTNVITVSKEITDAFDNFLDLLASSISDLEDEVGEDADGMKYIMNLTQKGQKMETVFSRLKEVLLRAPDVLGGPLEDTADAPAPVPTEPAPETQMKAGFGDADVGEPVE
jgi:hypothetical protein